MALDTLCKEAKGKCNVLELIIGYMFFKIFRVFLFPFLTCLSTHWCDVYTSKFKYLAPVRAHNQGGPVFF